jgi:predicted transcriptional regulator of viral defense system
MGKTLPDKIIETLEKNQELTVFSSNDFLELASGQTIRRVLNRMAERGEIRKIMRSFYYRPRYSKLLNEYEAASPHQIAVAIARKFNWNIAPSGLTALNLLGLSSQVPAKWTYICDGSYKTIQFDNIIIEFKRKNNREITGMSHKTSLVIQAISELGKNNISETDIARVQASLSETEKRELLKEGRSTLPWIYEIIKKIAG